jgi:hypothetical protein
MDTWIPLTAAAWKVLQDVTTPGMVQDPRDYRRHPDGSYSVRIGEATLARFRQHQHPGETDSDTFMRLVALKAGKGLN